MLKRERLQKIIEKVNINGIVTVNEIMEELDVSDMTVNTHPWWCTKSKCITNSTKL